MRFQNLKLTHFIWGLILLLLTGLFFTALIIKIQSNCFHATDFSIYQEAIFKISTFKDFNPFLHTRNINIFNDHFDPIIILAAVFSRLAGNTPEGLLFFEYLWFLAVLGIIAYSKRLTRVQKLFFITITLFTKGLLTGLNFPIHPTTWSMLPCFLLPLVIKRDRNIEIISLALFLCLFKESFPFGILMLSVFYLLTKKYQKGATLFVISTAFLIFNFKYRALLLGDTVQYGSTILKPVFNAPLQTIFKIITGLDYKSFFKVFYPFIIPFFLLLQGTSQGEKVWKKAEFLATLCFLLPMFAIQILANQIHHQYGAQITAPLLGLLFLFPNSILPNTKAMLLTMALFIASGVGSHSKNIRAIFAPKQRFCIISEKKDILNKELKISISKLPSASNILATGGVIPMLLENRFNFFQAGYFSRKMPHYDYLILERNGSGKTFPLTKDFIEEIIPTCEEESDEVILKSDYFVVFKNPKSLCIEPILKKWVAH